MAPIPGTYRQHICLLTVANRCALNQTAHYALCCVWLTGTTLVVLEFIVATLRRKDMAPVRPFDCPVVDVLNPS